VDIVDGSVGEGGGRVEGGWRAGGGRVGGRVEHTEEDKGKESNASLISSNSSRSVHTTFSMAER
jgi:hypothetical protein